MERTGDDMENIRMELEKLICYTMGREVITKEDGGGGRDGPMWTNRILRW